MSTITRYVLVGPDDIEADYEYTSCDDARQAARPDQAILERTYTYDDSELVETPCGCQTWPCRHCKNGRYTAPRG